MESLSVSAFEALDTLNVQLVLIAAVLCGAMKQKQGMWFGFSLFFFYALAVFLDPWIQSNDPLFIWRYVRWMLLDLTLLSWLYLLARRDLISSYVLIISASIEFVAILMLMIRMLDGFYSDATLTQPVFGPVIWATNFCYVVLAFSPVIRVLVRRSLKCN